MMDRAKMDTWYAANQKYLMASLDIVRLHLRRFVEQQADKDSGDYSGTEIPGELQKNLKEAAELHSTSPAIEKLASIFDLSLFEKSILLMCAGVELDSSFASLFAAGRESALHTFPTFSLALAALPEAHWSALMPNAPLRYWRFIKVKDNGVLTTSNLQIDEHILHYLAGLRNMHEQLSDRVSPVRNSGELVPSHKLISSNIIHAWRQAGENSQQPVVVQLCGADVSDRRCISSNTGEQIGMHLYCMSSKTIPNTIGEMTDLIRLWDREAALNRSLLLLECDEEEFADKARFHFISMFCESLNSPLIVSAQKRQSLSLNRSLATFTVDKPERSEQLQLWQDAMGKESDKFNGELHALASQFNLSGQLIRSVVSESMGTIGAESSGNKERDIGMVLWNACRRHTRPALDSLAQRIEPLATWNDLVLPEQQKTILREVALHVKYRHRVYDEFGFAGKCSRGLGITVLFSGDSGTGKTMASEVLANELQLDLFRIDLSQVVNKYIGETEKNLKRVFDAAEDSGAILLFDEADALFGKRSEVKDSHDRYANIEVSYLLQRMEAYHGLAILTTNLQNALDTAFLRRIRFVVQFPFPDHEHRAEIWRGIFPDKTPVNNLDVEQLARLHIAGGNIRNIALNSTFLATDENEAVTMNHLLRATRSEYAKLEKPLSAAEISGWEE